jgi:hypothetical protein
VPRRGFRATHCKYGHAYPLGPRKGSLGCRECHRLRTPPTAEQRRAYSAAHRARNPERRRAQVRASVARWGERHPEKKADAQRRAALLRRYGLTNAQYDALVALGGGVCWVCKKAPKRGRLHVEHDHSDGRVRAATCMYCNRFYFAANRGDKAEIVAFLLSCDFDGRDL